MADVKLKIVFLTGAGVSAESGIATFRDKLTGLWEQYNPMQLCTAAALDVNPQLVLDFYNMRRQKVFEASPNHAHEVIAQLEKDYEVHVVTQNVDDLHERAGSTDVIHVHGELRKVTSSDCRTDPECIKELPLNVPIKVGDKARDGSQLRPYIVFMDEYLPSLAVPNKLIKEADVFVIIGTSMSIGAGASLCHAAHNYVPKFIIDPREDIKLPSEDFTHIKAPATEGMDILVEELKKLTQIYVDE